MSPSTPIAIIGMSCRFPGGANNPEQLWHMLSGGRNAWSDVPSDRYNWEAFYNENREASGAHNHRGGHFLDQDISEFDAAFFGIHPVEANAMDPQQRVQLETVFEALENAGIPWSKVRGTNTSVYISVFSHDYERMLFKDPDNMSLYHLTGNGQAMLSNRISYIFDLKGASLTLDTGCSGGLVALHQACQSLRTGEAEMAIAGGVNLILSPDGMIPMSMLGVFSNEGKCFTFDQRRSGYGRGEGAATILLKPLDAAVRDNDPIRAVIHSTVLNQDGKTQGITSPCIEAQKRLICAAYEQAGLDPQDTGYVECHGTGTTVGDPIETQGIGCTIGKSRERGIGKPVWIGSVKPNIGHLESASGLAGVIKAVLVLEKGYIPPNTNYQFPNNDIQLKEWNLKIPLDLERWPTGDIRQVSVNSFGYGGTNAHAILTRNPPGVQHGTLTEVPDSLLSSSEKDSKVSVSQHQLFVLSAQTESSLHNAMRNLKEWITSGNPAQSSFIDLAYTLCCRRSLFAWRFSAVASTYDELLPLLSNTAGCRRSVPKLPIIFVFSGQGAQWAQMGLGLLESQPRFRESISRSSEILRDLGADWSVEDELRRPQQQSHINSSEIGQPVSTALQIALVDMLAEWNISPQSVVGHSSGEIAAAYAAKLLTHEDALVVSYHRGFLSASAKHRCRTKGSMLAVGIGEAGATNYIAQVKESEKRLCIACINSPVSTTVSGDESAILELQKLLEHDGIVNRILKVDTAYHSHHMALVADEYATQLGSLRTESDSGSQLTIKFFSSVTGRLKTSNFDAAYWVENLVSPVRFLDALREAYGGLITTTAHTQGSAYPIIEIGPHSVLKSPVTQTISDLTNGQSNASSICYLPTVQRGVPADLTALELMGHLFQMGYPINLDQVDTRSLPHRVTPRVAYDLPPYPWDHSQKYWHESRLSREYRLRERGCHTLLGTRCITNNTFEPTWRNLINVESTPWTRDHSVMGDIIFPATGYMVMAMEAMRQISSDSPITEFHMRDVSLPEALIIPNGPEFVEIQLSLRQWWNGASSSTSWKEFRIFSSSSKGEWVENCRGLVSIQKDQSCDEVELDREEILAKAAQKKTFDDAITNSHNSLNIQEMYANFTAHGLSYSDSFQGVTKMEKADTHTIGTVKQQSPSLSMPKGYEELHTIHPATFDACLQCALPLILSDCSLIPISFDEIIVASDIAVDQDLTVLSTMDQGHRMSVINQSVTQRGNPVLSIRGMKTTKLPNTSEEKEDDAIVYTMGWKPDIDHMDRSAIHTFCEVPLSTEQVALTQQRFDLLESTTAYFIDEGLRILGDQDNRIHMDKHHLELFHWMQRYQLASQAKDSNKSEVAKDTETLLERTKESGVEGEMLCRIGRSLVPILSGEMPALSVMLENDLLYRVYNDASSQRCYVHMCNCLQLLMHKNPNMRIIELGAGTGGATNVALETLAQDNVPLFDSYDFTDISSGFFEKAEQTFGNKQGRLRFKKLNIEEDPVHQGFEEASYDLVIAANVLHATSDMRNTMMNTRRLLKPGGRLLLLEITQPSSWGTMVFGTLPGWWKGVDDGRINSPLLSIEQWEKLLGSCSFSGLEVSIKDFPDECHRSTFMMSKAVTQDKTTSVGSTAIIQLNRAKDADLCLVRNITRTFHQEAIICTQETFPIQEVHPEITYIVMDDGDRPFLENPTAECFKEVVRLISGSQKLLWVSYGHRDPGEVKPERGLITGFARSARSENPGLVLVTLDVQKRGPGLEEQTAAMIRDVVYSSFSISDTRSHREIEYVEHTGLLHIPRLLKDMAVSKRIGDSSSSTVPESMPFHDDGHYWRLVVGKPGLLNTLHFVEDMEPKSPIADDEIEIEVRALGVNFRDIMVAMGQMRTDSTMAGDRSGVVTKTGLGPNLGFRVGDRVCAWQGLEYKSRSRVKAVSARRIPDNMSFHVAASIPVIFMTAYYCLIEVARLQPGQSILIHSASGGVGQAAIKIAQKIGARIFATVGSSKKKQLLIDTYGIPESQIFSSSRHTFRPGVLRLTDGKGVDIVLNSLAGEFLHASLACTSAFGTFIEIGKTDIYRKNRIDMSNFDGNVSFVSVDLLAIFNLRPKIAAAMMEEVMKMFESGQLTPVEPILVKPITEIEDAFRLVQARKHMGKVILDCSPGLMVKAVRAIPVGLEFPRNASYVISGGTGGLGIEICRWMASRGAKSLILLSRRGRRADGIHKLEEELVSLGSRLTVYPCNVSDKKELHDIVTMCQEQLSPVRGIIHGAMVLQDRMLEKMTLDDMETVFSPKVDGTRALIDAFSQSHIDFFVMLSSCAGVVGNHGQANYAAASTFQDTIAYHHFPHIRTIASMDLGMITGAGYVDGRPEVARVLKSQGYVPVRLDNFLTLLECVMNPVSSATFPRQAIIGIRPGSSGESGLSGHDSPSVFSDPKFRYLQSMTPNVQKERAQYMMKRKETLSHAATDDGKVQQIIAEDTAKKIALLTLTDREHMELSKPLADLGLDSLIMVELRNWINQTFGCRIKVSEIMKSNSLMDLAGSVHQQSKAGKALPASSINPDPKAEQEAIPALPLPTLTKTIERYLKSVRPLASDNEMETTTRCARAFLKAEGHVLQKRLEERLSDPQIENWAHDLYTDDVYLEDRRPLIPFTNYFAAYPAATQQQSPAKRAAMISFAAFEYKCLLEKNRLLPETINDRPVCMESYRWLFNACRIPGRTADIAKKWQSQDYLIAMRNGHFFKIPLRVRGECASIAQLSSAFQRVIENADLDASWLGVLTTDTRASWHQNRAALESISEENRDTLESIESADFVVCLDNATPATTEEGDHQIWHGDGANRWNDKPLQFIVCDNGLSGFVGEHSMTDGMTTRRLNEHIVRVLMETDMRKYQLDRTGASASFLPSLISFGVNSDIKLQVERLRVQFDNLTQGLRITMVNCLSYGTEFMAEQKCNPNAFVNMVLQVAFYRLYGGPMATYEPVSTGNFNKGRLDICRVVTDEVQSFCSMMTDQNTDRVKGCTLFKRAIQSHLKLVTAAGRGEGLDMHFLGLRRMIKEGERIPALFADPAFRRSSHFTVCTTTLAHSMETIGFYPVVDDGWSVSFILRDSSFHLNVISSHPQHDKLCDLLQQAAIDVKSLFY